MSIKRRKLLAKLADFDLTLDNCEENHDSASPEYENACEGFDRIRDQILKDLITDAAEAGELKKVLMMCASAVPPA